MLFESEFKSFGKERVVFNDFDLSILFENLNKDMLFLRFFGLRKLNIEKSIKMEREFESIKKEIIERRYIIPKGIYGIYRVKTSKKLLTLYSDAEYKIPLEINEDGFSIADFLSEQDYVALTSASCFLNNDSLDFYVDLNDFKKRHIINSIDIMLAEAFTEVLHYLAAKNRGLKVCIEPKELYLHKNPGKRYSPGYPGLDISVNKTIHQILKAYEIGSSITESAMIEPESSVQSIIVFNDKAFYL
ncbi:MAG: vitamin B12 dependent-methionine synthase activation domain-containing protein [Elusimicrobiales bacterium]